MCRTKNCNDEKKKRQAKEKAKSNLVINAKQLAPEILTMKGEGQRLWNWLLFGFGSLNNFVRGYAVLEVPGEVLPQLIQMRDFLNDTINQIETRASQSNGIKE